MSDEEFEYPSDMDSFEENSDFPEESWEEGFPQDDHDTEDFTSNVPYGKQFICMTPDDIISKQQQSIKSVNSVLPNLPVSSIRILLQKYNWDPTRVISSFTEDPERICKQTGIPLPSQETGISDVGTQQCLICFDEDELVALPCGHAYCGDCWNSYLNIQVKEMAQKIVCCGEDCNMVMDEIIVLELLRDSESKTKFKQVLMNSFVQDNLRCKWCPAPGCSNAILLLDVFSEGNEVVQCDCGHSFCFRCLQKDHRPCSCKIMQEWKKIHGGENTGLDESYVAAYSRPCPRCQSPIEKNHGCNHMTCKCGFHFCWVCMKKFGSGSNGGTDGYSNHKCNGTYEEDDSTKSKKAELEKFKHYSERYENHLLSAKLESKLLSKEETILGVLKHEGYLGNDFSPAVHQILQNRNVLANSYAFGYYRGVLAKYVNKGIFENLQLDLERHTELLSRLTSEFAENALSDNPTDTDERRQAVVNQTRIGAKVLDALLDASSAWSQKAIIEEEEEQEENIIESIQEAKIPEKRKKKRTKEKKKSKSSRVSSTKKDTLEKLQQAETSEDEKPKKKKRKFFRVHSSKNKLKA